ncbi:MAG: tetratricopeptide repeat protein [Acidobacteriota bacterium]|nr:tetratricopeptide repeat protein [Acidobacteriota bacterium]
MRVREVVRMGVCLVAALWVAPWLSAQAKHGSSAAADPPVAGADAKVLARALQAYDERKDAEAEPALRELAARYPRNYVISEALGSLYAGAGELSQALPLLERARRLRPQEAIARANLGAAYLKLNRPGEAVAELQAAARVDPRNADTEAALGQALLQQNEPGKAMEALTLANSLRPDDPELKYNLAIAQLGAGRIRQAEATVGKIPSAAVTDQVQSLAGDIHERLGNYTQAVLDYQAAARMNPSDANLFAVTAELLRHWTWDEAIAMARYGETRYPGSTHFRMAEGIGLYASGKYAQAAPVFSSLLAAEPDNGTFADLLGRSCSLVEEGVSAECEGLEAFARKHTENAQAATYAAAALLHRPAEHQNTEQAELFLRQAIAADPKLPEAYFELGVLEQGRLQWKESASSLERAIALRPAYTEAHYRLSRAYSHMGRREDAQREIVLQQRYSQQEKDSLNTRLQEVVKFIVKPS